MNAPPADPTAEGLARTGTAIRGLLAQLSLIDWLLLGYYVVLWLAAYQGEGPRRGHCLNSVFTLFVIECVMLFLVRSGRAGQGPVAALTYRIVTYGCFQVSYFLLRDLLPTVTSRTLDAQLYRLDVRLFHFEPTIALDRFVSPATTEWFSFFYFLYFVLIAIHVFPMMFATRRYGLLGEFGTAVFLLFCTAHVLYMLVPGFGPVRYLAAHYQHALPAGRWHDLVISAVEAGGAQKDIFPSNHTAAPTLVALFSYTHRKEFPFRYTWPFVAFFTLNIIGATVFLRWHYVIDVFAGLALASTAVWLGGRLSRREDARRAELGLTPSWPPLFRERGPVRDPHP